MGIVLAGWASNSKYALIGAVRSSAQMVSYEVAVGLSLIGPLMFAQSLSLQGIIDGQRLLGIPYLLVQPIAFLIYVVGSLAETNRAPFDLPEAEAELVAGFHTEYSGFRWALFFMAEYANIIIVTAIAVTAFLGGWWFPGMESLVAAIAGEDMTTPLYSITFVMISIAAFGAKIFVLIYFFMWVRWTLPRYRYDQLMDLGWKWLIPTALANVVLTGVIYVIALEESQGGLLGFFRATSRGLVINTDPAIVGYAGMAGLSFLFAVPATWWLLAKINRTTEDFNLHARRQLQIQRRAERLAAIAGQSSSE
jgi:NADH-quinone oxidoreductase subunit H